uniref:Delta-sarcoglycan n=1 Tax=Panagrellus redivivus TaxID=6233 RepID=A0A7E4ZSN7_PANRE
MPYRDRSTVQNDIWTRDPSVPAPSAYERHSTQPRGASGGPYAGGRPGIIDPSLPPSGAGPAHTTIVHSTMKPVPDSDIYRVGIYGWRKRCLYCFILILTLIIVINLVLTVWIMIVLNFGIDGMGALKVTDDGIRVTGKTKFEKSVQFSQISTENNKALTLESALGVSLSAHNISGDTTASLDLATNGKVSASCERFEIVDRDNKLLFFADSNEVGLKLNNLRILDDGGTVFEGAIQTGTIRPEPDTPLSLESPTRGVKISAGQDIELLSSAGEFSLNALQDINLNSKKGDIHFDGRMYISGLERSHGRGTAQYQLCVCQNGRLFMAAENADCRADKDICE